MRHARFLTGTILVVALATASAASGGTVRTPHVQRATITILPSTAGAEAVARNPNIAVAIGIPVKITIRNFTHQFHTFTIPGLHKNALAGPARGSAPSTTVVTFTARESGPFAWYCVLCRHGGHGRAHEMGGLIYATIPPSLMP